MFLTARSAAVVLYLSHSLYPTQAEAAAESALNKKAESTERASAEHLFAVCGSAVVAARFMRLISAMKKEQHASDIVLLFNGLTDELLLVENL